MIAAAPISTTIVRGFSAATERTSSRSSRFSARSSRSPPHSSLFGFCGMYSPSSDWSKPTTTTTASAALAAASALSDVRPVSWMTLTAPSASRSPSTTVTVSGG